MKFSVRKSKNKGIMREWKGKAACEKGKLMSSGKTRQEGKILTQKRQLFFGVTKKNIMS